MGRSLGLKICKKMEIKIDETLTLVPHSLLLKNTLATQAKTYHVASCCCP